MGERAWQHAAGPTVAVKVVTEVVAEALEVLRLGRPPDEVLHHVAVRLGEAVRADAVCVGSLDLPALRCELRTSRADLDTEPLVAAALGMPRAHPVLDHWLAGHTDVVAVSSLVGDRRAWRRSPAYDVLRRTLGCTETGGIRLDAGTPVLRMIGFAREVDFTADEVALLALARRPVIAVVEHATWLAALPTPASEPLAPVLGLGLTGREHQVLQLLAEGLQAVSIARRLSVSTRTVHRHLSHLYVKLGTHDRLGAVIRAQELGLVEPALGRTTHGREVLAASS